MSKFGIDISTWQDNLNYSLATSQGVKFAILRAGFSTTKDNQFEKHYENAKKQGWEIGAYWYSYATSKEEAISEAKTFVKTIKGKKFTYPIYLDIEDKSLSGLGKDLLNEIVNSFAKVIEDAGYYFGVYTDSYKWGKCECVNGMYNGKFEINQTGIYETSFITGIIANGLYDGTTASESEYSLESFTTERNEQYARGILLESKWETTENGQLVGSGQETQSGELDNRFESIYYMGGTIPLDELPTGDEIEIYPY